MEEILRDRCIHALLKNCIIEKWKQPASIRIQIVYRFSFTVLIKCYATFLLFETGIL